MRVLGIDTSNYTTSVALAGDDGFRQSRKILSIGIPAAIQAIVITLSNLIVQANINRLGVDSIAAFTAYFKVENFIYLPIMAFGSASSTFTSQNCGAALPRAGL